jgi:hypothetical protein
VPVPLEVYCAIISPAKSASEDGKSEDYVFRVGPARETNVDVPT